MITKSKLNYLSKRDIHLSKAINKYLIQLPKADNKYFHSLCKWIIYQQLSGKAAKTIYERLIRLVGGSKKIRPLIILNLSSRKLRSVGISSSKSTYLKELAKAFEDNDLKRINFSLLSNDMIVDTLIKIKGIGYWTIDMFLIFTLNREDILSVKDAGIKRGIKLLYKLNKEPDELFIKKKSSLWAPYRSIASLYIWKVADNGI